MNAYVVRMNEMRSYVEPITDDGRGPEFSVLPIAPVVAESRNAAKALFLREFSHRPRSGVETDDYPNLRTRLLFHDVTLFEPSLARGVHEERDDLWLRLHEVDDHAGAPCDCPEATAP